MREYADTTLGQLKGLERRRCVVHTLSEVWNRGIGIPIRADEMRYGSLELKN